MLATQTPDAPVEPKHVQQVKLSSSFVEFSPSLSAWFLSYPSKLLKLISAHLRICGNVVVVVVCSAQNYAT